MWSTSPNAWACLTLLGVSVARSRELHVRTTSAPNEFLLEEPHVWATCVACETDTRLDAEVLRLQSHSWTQTEPHRDRTTGEQEHFIVLFPCSFRVWTFCYCFLSACCSNLCLLTEGSSGPQKTKCWRHLEPEAKHKP